MEGIINRILEIDRTAEERLTNARLIKQKTVNQTFVEAGRLEETLKSQAEETIANVERINDKYYGELLKRNEEKYASEAENLKIFYSSQHEIIEDKIFAEIVGDVP